MAADKTGMALKPFMEGLKDLCDKMRKEELTSFILEMGQEVSLRGRSDFL